MISMKLTSTTITFVLVVPIMVWGNLRSSRSQTSYSEGTTGWISQGAPPPPGPVPPNASRVTGTVRKVSVWPPGSLQGKLPPVPSNETFYSILLEIQTSDPENAQLENLAQPGG